MAKTINCKSCGQHIKYRDEFVAGIIILVLMPYHTDCFSRELKKSTALILANEPVNGVLGTFSAVVSGLASIGLLLFAGGLIKWLALLTAIPAFYRILVFILYERHLYD